jgi:hypothetical protein
MPTDDEIRYAESDYNAALVNLMKCRPGKEGFGIEAKYGEAYQALVRLGVKPQLRMRYRGR